MIDSFRKLLKPNLRLAVLFATLTIIGCADRESVPDVSASPPPAVQVPLLERHCFRDVFELPDAQGEEDVLELLVVTSGANATGQYNWLPARKDRRIGTLDGHYGGGRVEAAYAYQQEGRAGEEKIIIELGDNAATVSGGPPELGLSGTITRVACR